MQQHKGQCHYRGISLTNTISENISVQRYP